MEFQWEKNLVNKLRGCSKKKIPGTNFVNCLGDNNKIRGKDLKILIIIITIEDYPELC